MTNPTHPTGRDVTVPARRHRRRSAVLLVTVLALVAAACEYDPADFAAFAAFSECEGEPATIGIGYNPNTDPANGSVYVGTEGRDVVVITNGPVTFNALGGDDLICINTGVAWGDGTSCLDWGCGTIVIDVGSGNNTVHNNSSHPAVNQEAEAFPLTYPLAVRDVHVEQSCPIPDWPCENSFFGGPAAESVVGFVGGSISTGEGDDIIAWSDAADLVDCGPGSDLYLQTTSALPGEIGCEDYLYFGGF